MGLHTTHGCWRGAYSAFMRWRMKLAEVAGFPPLLMMDGYFHAYPVDTPASKTAGDAMSTWSSSTLPGCFGHSCEMLSANGGVARVWQASLATARGSWCWQLNDGDVHVTRGNRGVAKTAAKRALLGDGGAGA